MIQKRHLPFGTMTVTPRARALAIEALDQKRISCGKLVREFEERFAAIVGCREAVAVSSGTDADILALAVMHDDGAQRGDEVIVPALSFVATGNAVIHAGFTPVFVDIERETLNLDVSKVEAAITDRTRAVMPVHLMGKPAAMDHSWRLPAATISRSWKTPRKLTEGFIRESPSEESVTWGHSVCMWLTSFLQAKAEWWSRMMSAMRNFFAP